MNKETLEIKSGVKLHFIKTDLFKALVYQTLFRPRDLINLLKILQKQICIYGSFSEAMYNDALKKYSNWLVNTELANEINPVLQDDYKFVIELLRLCGSRNMNLTSFTFRYKSVNHDFKMTPLELLEYLYSVGMIENCWKDKTGKYIRLEDQRIVPKLLQKRYDTKVLALAKEELHRIEKFLDKNDHDLIKELFKEYYKNSELNVFQLSWPKKYRNS